MERALVVVKPDGVEKRLIGRIIERFEKAGLRIVAIKMVRATKGLAGRHYANDRKWLMSVGKKTKAAYLKRGVKLEESEIRIGMRIRSLLMKELTRTPIVAIVLEGDSANAISREIAGATEPRSADPSSIRGMYSSDSYQAADRENRPVRNIVHVSEDRKSAEREIRVWFKRQEIQEYK